MLARTIATPPSAPAWQRSLASSVRTVGELLDLVGLSRAELEPRLRAASSFPVRVPRELAARIRPGEPNDPILLQVLPASEELVDAAGFDTDPVAERGAAPATGLIHKYDGRALLITTGVCAVNCRYCFRRHFPYGDHVGWSGEWDEAIDYLDRAPAISEVILSGGDPLAIADSKLARLAGRLAAVAHLRRLRLHTRLPVAVPSRVDDELLGWLTGTRLQPVVVLHVNHPQELDDAVGAAVARLRSGGVPVLNQSVLLRGVNDSAPVLVKLSERLFEIGVLPYYLHLLDPVAGAAHYDVPEARARRIASELRARLPGYLVPRVVREVPGAPGKVWLGPWGDGR